MYKIFTDHGWKDYLYWQTEDRKTLKRINNLIEDVARNGNEGIGKEVNMASKSSSIGVIGGADGPTAIFVAGNGLHPGYIALAIGILAGVIYGTWLFLKRKTNRI